jgi:hypothetical protein
MAEINSSKFVDKRVIILDVHFANGRTDSVVLDVEAGHMMEHPNDANEGVIICRMGPEVITFRIEQLASWRTHRTTLRRAAQGATTPATLAAIQNSLGT